MNIEKSLATLTELNNSGVPARLPENVIDTLLGPLAYGLINVDTLFNDLLPPNVDMSYHANAAKEMQRLSGIVTCGHELLNNPHLRGLISDHVATAGTPIEWLNGVNTLANGNVAGYADELLAATGNVADAASDAAETVSKAASEAAETASKAAGDALDKGKTMLGNLLNR